MIQRPRRLEVVLHPLLQLLGDLMQGEEVLQVTPLGVVERPPGVHPLDDGGDVTEDHGVHQS